MLYLAYFEVPIDVGNRIDFEEGGPGQVIGYMMKRFAPQAAYAEAGTRNVFIIADLNEAQMTELSLVVSKKLDTFVEFTPLISAADLPEIAGKAIEEVKKAF